MIRTVLIAGLLFALGLGAGWKLQRTQPVITATLRCSMHPWVTAGVPGKCTVCGMGLVPAGTPAAEVCGLPAAVLLEPAVASVIGVQTAAVTRQPLVRTLRVAGTIEVDETRRRYVTAWTDGRVDRLHVRSAGDQLRAGEPMLALYSRNLLDAQQELLTLTRNGQNSFSAVAEHKLQMLQLGFTPRQVEDLLVHQEPSSTPVLMAPANGTVLAKEVTEGQWVRTGDRLFEIADLSRLWFTCSVPASERDWLQPGQPVRITAGTASFTTPLAFIDPTVDPATGAVLARAEFDNEIGLARGLYAEGLITAESPPVLAVPRAAVLDTGAGPVAWIDRGRSIYEARALRLGRRGDVLVEVLAGLAEGERVVAQGALLIDAQARLAPSGSR